MEAKLIRSQMTRLHSAKFITLSVDSLTKALAGWCRVLSSQCTWKSAWSMKVEADKSVTRVIYVWSGFTNCDTAATHRHEVWSRWIWQRIMEAKLMWADEVLGGIWSFIKYEVVKWYWMRRDHHTGWMVPCSLQPVYAKKYVKWKQEGEVCVDVRLLVFLGWRAVVTLTRAFS